MWTANEETEISSWNVGAANEKRFVVSALTPVPSELGDAGGTWEGREAQVPPLLLSPMPDMTTPLGLSRQHLSYLQEIGSGWFGKVSKWGWGWEVGALHNPGRLSCSVSIAPAPTTSHLPPASSPCPLGPPIALPFVHLPPAPTHPIPSICRSAPPSSLH